MFSKCGEQYRRRYIERHIIPPTVALLRGGAVHTGAEVNWKAKIESHENLPESDIVDASVASFDAKIKADGILLSKEEESVGQKKVVGVARDSVARLGRLFRNSVAPLYQPLKVEEQVLIPVPQASHDIKCILDLIPDDGGLQDLKTSKKKGLQADWDKSAQFTFYAIAYKRLMGERPQHIAIDQLIDTGKGEPRHEPFKTTRTDGDFNALAARINTFLAALKTGVFTPAPTGCWWCSSMWCGYARTCPYYNSERDDEAVA